MAAASSSASAAAAAASTADLDAQWDAEDGQGTFAYRLLTFDAEAEEAQLRSLIRQRSARQKDTFDVVTQLSLVRKAYGQRVTLLRGDADELQRRPEATASPFSPQATSRLPYYSVLDDERPARACEAKSPSEAKVEPPPRPPPPPPQRQEPLALLQPLSPSPPAADGETKRAPPSPRASKRVTLQRASRRAPSLESNAPSPHTSAASFASSTAIVAPEPRLAAPPSPRLAAIQRAARRATSGSAASSPNPLSRPHASAPAEGADTARSSRSSRSKRLTFRIDTGALFDEIDEAVAERTAAAAEAERVGFTPSPLLSPATAWAEGWPGVASPAGDALGRAKRLTRESESQILQQHRITVAALLRRGAAAAQAGAATAARSSQRAATARIERPEALLTRPNTARSAVVDKVCRDGRATLSNDRFSRVMAEEPLVTVARDPRQPRVKSFAKQRAARPLGPEVPRVEDRHALARPEDAPRPRTAGAEWAFNSGTDRGLSTRSHLESLAEYAEARVGVGPGSYDPSGPRAHEPVGQLLLMTSRESAKFGAPVADSGSGVDPGAYTRDVIQPVRARGLVKLGRAAAARLKPAYEMVDGRPIGLDPAHASFGADAAHVSFPRTRRPVGVHRGLRDEYERRAAEAASPQSSSASHVRQNIAAVPQHAPDAAARERERRLESHRAHRSAVLAKAVAAVEARQLRLRSLRTWKERVHERQELAHARQRWLAILVAARAGLRLTEMKKRIDELSLLESASILIQRAWRGFRERREMLRRKRQVRGVLSKNFLHFITNHRIRRKRKAAATISRFLQVCLSTRNSEIKLSLCHLRFRVVVLQRFWRRCALRLKSQTALMCLQWQKVDDEHAYIRRAALREINSRLGALRAAFETGGAVAFENASPVAMPTHLVAKQLTAYSSMALALRHYIGARERISNRFSVVATMPLTPRKSQLLPHSRQNSSQLPAHALAVAPPSPRSMQPLPPSPPRPREQPSDEDLDGWRRHSFVSPQVKREVLRQAMREMRAAHARALEAYESGLREFVAENEGSEGAELEALRLYLTGVSAAIESSKAEFERVHPRPVLGLLLPEAKMKALVERSYALQIERFAEDTAAAEALRLRRRVAAVSRFSAMLTNVRARHRDPLLAPFKPK